MDFLNFPARLFLLTLVFALLGGCGMPFQGPANMNVTCTLGVVATAAACQQQAAALGCPAANTTWTQRTGTCTADQCAKQQQGSAGYSVCGVGAVTFPAANAETMAMFTDWPSSGDALATKATAATNVPLATKATAEIVEYPLSTTGMKPGPIIVAGQRIMLGAMAPCRSEGFCANTGIYIVDPAASRVVTQAENFCARGDVACRLTGLTALPDGGYCYGAHNIVMNFEQKSDMIACVTGGARYEHYMRMMGGYVTGLTYGPDGKVWFVDSDLNGIGRLAAKDVGSLAVTLSSTKTQLGFGAIANGPGNTVWFTALYGNRIGRIDPSGSTTFFPVPAADSQPFGIAAGPDGNLWFTEFKGNRIGRITPAGVVTEFVLPGVDSGPVGIAAGPDGAMWFTEFNANRIGRITTFGSITEFDVPTPDAQPAGIVAGPNDGTMWFTEFNADKVARLTVPLPQVVEFYNTNLDNYFITANAAEQAAIDSGSAGPGWTRTGNSFASGGASTVCRFYGSIAPGPNSHFYTADPNECAQLKQIQATTPATQKRWNFESNDFETTPAVKGACPTGLVPVYRAYNNGFNKGIDSNHRITASAAGIAAVVAKGWSNEGIVMCAPAQ